MPFIGRDWRSPGEAWVKTESLGWQRAKIIESTGCCIRSDCRSSSEHLDTSSSCHSPRCWPGNLGGKLSLSKSLSPDQRDQNACSSSLDDSHIVDCFDNQQPQHQQQDKRDSSNQVSQSSCPANSTWCSIENFNSEQELLTSTPTVHHHRQPSGEQSCTPSLSPSISSQSSISDSESSSRSQQDQELQQQQWATKKASSKPILVKLNNQLISPLFTSNNNHNHNNSNNNNNNNNNKPLVNESQSLSSDYHRDEANQRTLAKQSSSSLSHSAPLSSARLNPIRDGQVNIVDTKTVIDINHRQSACCHHDERSPSPTLPCNVTHVKQAPHCQITIKPTREVANYNTISEAFCRLDFCNAIHDIRRFNYICKLLHLLITQNLTSLSGCATRILFTMLEQVAWQADILNCLLLELSINLLVSSNKQNIHILYTLLDDLKKMIQKYYCWGRPIGSSLLWQQHFSTLERISHLADQIDIAPPPSGNNDPQKTINDLPVELIHEIMLRLNDYRDLVNSAAASSVMQSILNGQHIWRQLCKYHFSKQQLRLAIENHYGVSKTKTSWSSNVKFARFVSADGRSICRKPVKDQSQKTRQQSTNSHKNEKFGQIASRLPCQDSGKLLERSRLLSVTMPGRLKTSQQLDRIDEAVDRPPLNDLSNASQHSKKNNNDVASVNNNCQNISDNHKHQQELDWEQVFHQLRKKFGLREEYADCLLLCRHCRCLFWKSFGHPCIIGDQINGSNSLSARQSRTNPCMIPSHVAISPQAFLKFFSL